jgi:hypothetical protein
MDGFYVKQNCFYKTQEKKNFKESSLISQSLAREYSVAQGHSDSVISENSLVFSTENNTSNKNIIIASKPIFLKKIIFQKDTLPKKKKDDYVKVMENKGEVIDNRKTPTIAIIGFLLCFIPVLDILGFVLSIIAYRKINNNPEKYKGIGFAVAGIAIGLYILLAVMYFLFIIRPDFNSPLF